MVVKKKRTYKKQKGGLFVLHEELRNKIYPYFDFVKYLINRIIYFLEKQYRNISINQFIIDMNLSTNDNILIQKLYQKIMYILQNNLNHLNSEHF